MSTDVFSRVLVGIDGSDASNEALAFGVRLTRERNGHLVVCHSADWFPIVSEMASTGATIDTSSIVDDLNKEGRDELDRAVGEAKRNGVNAQARAREGDPAQALLEVAAEENCSAIVMGTHGRDGLNRLLVGSTTEAVLRGSTIPVLTVRPGTKQSDANRRCFERIIVGIDESEPSVAAFRTVVNFLDKDRRDVLFCSVAGTGDEEHERAARLVAKTIALAHLGDVPAQGQVLSGKPAAALVALAQQWAADLIVLGSHGRTGLERLFIGSVAEHVARTAPLPVLIVRTREGVPVTPVLMTKPATVVSAL